MDDTTESLVDPFTHAWNQLAAQLVRAPNITSLPREEVIRLCRCFFYLGASVAIMPIMQGWYGVRNEDDLAMLHEVTFAVGKSITDHKLDDTIGKLLATMEAHAS